MNEVTVSNMPILDITCSSYDEMGSRERSILTLRVIDVASIRDRDVLVQRMAEYIHFNSLRGVPCKLSTINRRFNRAAKRLGTTTTELVNRLADVGVIRTLTGATSNTLLVSEAYMVEREAFQDQEGFSDLERAEAFDRFIAKAE